MRAPDITRRTGLNRTVLLRPGATWHGRPAGRVLGATGLSATVRAAASEAEVAVEGAPLLVLDRALRAGDAWAEGVAEEWVDAFAHLLRTVRSPTAADRAARAEWTEADWARWETAARVVVCGGVVAGELGSRASGDPRLRAHGAEVAPDPGRAALVGLAVGVGDDPGVVLDLGHSSIKASRVRQGLLGPSVAVAVPWTPFETRTWPAPTALLDLVAQACRRVLPDDHETGPLRVRVAIANYVVDGRLDDDETYGTIARPEEDPRARLSGELSARLGRPVQVDLLVNDGAAAALSVPSPLPAAAVISIGTSLGTGFTGA
ncbi:hypothetical protein [uncultured Serinicoccus sp.]|uniref:hypothetical protein n=1 Tax=uncultured Serinicoccus sp. TaxID=735514 RepID=UPI002634B7F8|nr:hypothetical protein [uncultured Serinicoccus sp.]